MHVDLWFTMQARWMPRHSLVCGRREEEEEAAPTAAAPAVEALRWRLRGLGVQASRSLFLVSSPHGVVAARVWDYRLTCTRYVQGADQVREGHAV